MHHRPLFLALLLACATGSAAALQVCEVNGEAVNTSNGASTRGKTGLMRCRDSDTGALQREQELRDGAFVGVERFYHSNGKLREEHARNARGNKHGLAREFDPQGQLLRESTYEDGRELGIARSFHPVGALRRITFHGAPGSEQASAEFTPAGQLSSLRCGPRPLLAPAVDDQKLCGFTAPSDVELFDGQGRLRLRLRYVQGKPVRSESLHANGQPAVVEEIEGTRRTEKRFSAEGRLQREQAWADGQAVGDRSFWMNGQPRSSTEWVRAEGGVQRIASEFHDNGQLASRGAWLQVPRGRSIAVGPHERFDAQGRKVAETLHDAQGRPVRERAWDAQGQLVRDDAVFEDGSRRAFTR